MLWDAWGWRFRKRNIDFGLDGLYMFSLQIWNKVKIIILPWLFHNAANNNSLIIIPLSTLGSVYSTSASGSQQTSETNDSNWT